MTFSDRDWIRQVAAPPAVVSAAAWGRRPGHGPGRAAAAVSPMAVDAGAEKRIIISIADIRPGAPDNGGSNGQTNRETREADVQDVE